MNRKLLLTRRKHAQTREYMEMNALRGIVKDGAGTTLYNYFAEFGLAQISVDFVRGTAGTNVQGKVREVLRAIEDNLLGEDVRRNFPFGGILFEEYSGTVTLSTKATERLVPANEGIAFPLGTMDTFTTYGGPANLLKTAKHHRPAPLGPPASRRKGPLMVDVRVADLPAPRPGDVIVIGADSHVIQGEPLRDRERLIWTLDLRPA